MEAQDAWWDAQQDEGRVEPDPDEKADPDCPEEFVEDFTVENY